MPKPKNSAYWEMPRNQRFQLAVQRVIKKRMSQRQAADEYGVSLSALNARVQKAQGHKDEAKDRRQAAAATKANLVLPTKTDVEDFIGFVEWEEKYFGHFLCPNCQVRHDTPDFHKDIIEELEHPTSQRFGVNTPTYHAKSTLVTTKWVVYQICRDPNYRCIIVSKGSEMAKDFVRQIQEILSNNELYADAPHNLIEDFGPFKEDASTQLWSAMRFNVSGRTTMEKDPTVQALGVSGQIYGKRADEIICDDIATLGNQANPAMVAQMLRWLNQEVFSRVGSAGRVIFVGTRVHAGDIYGTLKERAGYAWKRYSLVVDDENEDVLWSDHFTYEQAMVHKSEMTESEFQLVMQNVDMPGEGASFTQEMIDSAMDLSRFWGHFDPKWRIFAGLDLAGDGKHAGFTAMTVIGLDTETGMRYLIDQTAHRSMKAPQMKAEMFRLTDLYPISEWRVERNGMQGQLLQYDTEIVKVMNRNGIKLSPHTTTGQNKWDPQFGVEGRATLFNAGMMSIPGASQGDRKLAEPFCTELLQFPMGAISDRVMSWWFADLAAQQFMQRLSAPMFDARASARMPNRVKRKRGVVNFSDRTVRGISLAEQDGSKVYQNPNQRRMVVGTPTEHHNVRPGKPSGDDPYMEKATGFVNIEN